MFKPLFRKFPLAFLLTLCVLMLLNVSAYALDASAQYYYGLTIGESVALEDMLAQMDICQADDISCATLKGKGVELYGDGNTGYTVTGVEQGCAVITVCLSNSQAVAVNVNAARSCGLTGNDDADDAGSRKLSSSFAFLGEDADRAYVAGLNEAALELSKDESYGGKPLELKLCMAETNAKGDSESLSAEALKDRKTVGMLFDLALSLQTEDGQTQELVSSPSMLVLHIPLPEELQGRDRYSIYRIHNGSVQAITEGTYGEHIVANSDRSALDIYVQNFCSYALTWEDVERLDLRDGTDLVFSMKMTVVSFIGLCLVLTYVLLNARRRGRR